MAVADQMSRLRRDLAAVFRIAARLGWPEAVANHCSVAASEDGRHFLINPRWRHFALLRASELLLLDSRAPVQSLPADLDPTAWAIHGTLHAELPRARCILHVHPPHATALSCLADREIKPIDQTSARFYRRVAIDRDYGGLADNVAEGRRLLRVLGEQQVLMMGNHGVLVVAEGIAEAFDALYHFERACHTLLLAYASGQAIAPLSPEIAEQTARSWEDGGEFARAHFEQMKQLLEADGVRYAD